MDTRGLAAKLYSAYEKSEPLTSLPSRDSGLDLAAAYAVEAELMQMRIAAGDRVAGRKVGFANKALWRVLKLDTLVWAHMYESTVRYCPTNSGTLSLRGRIAPKIEPEIVFKLKKPLAGSTDAAAIVDSVDWLALGFEIIDCIFPGWEFQPADFVAAFGFHAGLVVGEPLQVQPDMIADIVERLPNFQLKLLKNASLVEEGSGKNSLRSPALCLGELARLVPLASGELVSSGTLTTPQLIAPGETWTAEIDGLDLPNLQLHLQE